MIASFPVARVTLLLCCFWFGLPSSPSVSEAVAFSPRMSHYTHHQGGVPKLNKRVAALSASSASSTATTTAFAVGRHRRPELIIPRGGNQSDGSSEVMDDTTYVTETTLTAEEVAVDTSTSDADASLETELDTKKSTTSTTTTALGSSALITKLAGVFNFLGQSYSLALEARPILTKSVTAGVVFGISDYLAQMIERHGIGGGGVNGSQKGSNGSDMPLDATRLFASALIGLLYFGPAAHYWYEWIFKLFPSTSLVSTMVKAFWGQMLFGPSFTCLFFASSLLQTGDFSLKKWWQKICSDLPGAWLAGTGFWPIVDLISYSVIPLKLIPLFINMASLLWTIYLSLVANRSSSK